MKILTFILLGLATSAVGREFAVHFEDERGRPVEQVKTRVLLMGENAPTAEGIRAVEAVTPADGKFSFTATNNMGVINIQAQRPGFYSLELHSNHGIPQPEKNRPQAFQLTIPRRINPIPLFVKEVRLARLSGELKRDEWIAFDLQRASPLPPYGRGLVEDFRFRITATMTGWDATPEYIEQQRRYEPDRKWDDETIRGSFGAWRAELQIAFPHPLAGIVRTDRYWRYCRLKMPHEAPAEGYLPEYKGSYETGRRSRQGEHDTGFYLRTRVVTDKDGRIIEAHYSKIMRSIKFTHGYLSFVSYFNPTPNDRNLEFDPEQNLMVPPRGTDGPELSFYQISDP